MKNVIQKAIEAYATEEQELTRIIPDPEVLTDWILEALREQLI